jgi:peptidoglycan hydrolase-like protein with peptidoglycan-binding domain
VNVHRIGCSSIIACDNVRMRRIIRSLVLIGFFLSLPSIASAATAAELKTQIEAMLAEVQRLQADLVRQGSAGGQAQAPAIPSTNRAACPLIGRVLKRGMTGDDVSRLQTYLSADQNVYPEAQVTGYYGGLTEAAVERWQTQNNIVSSGDAASTGFGVVGPRNAAAIALQCATGGGGGDDGGGAVEPTVGGFLQVTPVTGVAPHTVQVVTTVNTVLSCAGAVYGLDWGDGTVPQVITVPKGNCTQMQTVYSHIYLYPSTYTVRLYSGQHQTTATVQVGIPGVVPDDQ